MHIMKPLKGAWCFLHEDTWQSWLVSLVLVIIGIKFIFFPLLSFITATPLPLVVVESCSMYHGENFDRWWQNNAIWYEAKDIDKEKFSKFQFKNGLNKGDIIVVWGRSLYKQGDIIIFNAPTKYPIIHRIIEESPRSTKGDNNTDQIQLEKNISDSALMGKAAIRIPFLGWIKLIFFELGKNQSERGFCR